MTLTVAAIELATKQALEAINGARDLNQLKEVKIEHVGDKSPVAKLNQGLGQLDPAQRAEFGKILGEAKSAISVAFANQQTSLEIARDAQVLFEEVVDVTLPASNSHIGGLHPLTVIKNEVSDYFLSLGYSIAEGPELEAGWLNFDSLNIPTDHPARTMQDTFFIEPVESGLVLRTHTSPVQMRTLLTQNPPIYIASPGRTYRADELDATHSPVFNQIEGLVVDQGITMAHLKGALDDFAMKMFGAQALTRLRPSFFPFTEPSAEVDVWFNNRWIEWGGCGMVNPRVLETAGLDTSVFSGFAFGMGLERTLMVRQGIKDMHDIVEGDIRFSRSFGLGL